MQGKIDWWEGNPNSIVVLQPSFLSSINISKQISSVIGVSIRALHRWKDGSRRPLLRYLMKYVAAVGMEKESLDKEIIGFASFNGNRIWRAKFPVQEHPSHLGIIAHGFFDGNECCNVLVYGTLTKEENDDFARLVAESIPGAYLLDYSRGRKGLPASITQLLKNHYGIPTFFSDRCVFSEKIMSIALNDGQCRKEILRAAFLDEGHVTLKSGICAFGIKNDELTHQVCRLLDAGGYSHWSAQTPSETQVYLRFGSCKHFYSDILSDMPVTYRKNKRIIKLLAKLEKTRKKKEFRQKTLHGILSMVEKSKKLALSDIYAGFKVGQRNKKTFYNRYVRKLKGLHLIETITQGDMTWVLVPESGKPESKCFRPIKRRGE